MHTRRYVDEFEKLFNIQWRDAAAIELVITRKIPTLLSLDKAYQNARKYSDAENARIEGELAIKRAISSVLADHIQLFHQFTENSQFRVWVSSVVFDLLDEQLADTIGPESK